MSPAFVATRYRAADRHRRVFVYALVSAKGVRMPVCVAVPTRWWTGAGRSSGAAHGSEGIRRATSSSSVVAMAVVARGLRQEEPGKNAASAEGS